VGDFRQAILQTGKICRFLLILPVYSGSKPNFPLFTGSSNCIYARKWVLEIGNRKQGKGIRK